MKHSCVLRPKYSKEKKRESNNKKKSARCTLSRRPTPNHNPPRRPCLSRSVWRTRTTWELRSQKTFKTMRNNGDL
jgi:hypothetical protein